MICLECQRDITEHLLYGCHAGEATIREDDLAALREKAALWDALSARIAAGEWDLPISESPVAVRIRRTGERVHGATLEDAVKAAMEAEER